MALGLLGLASLVASQSGLGSLAGRVVMRDGGAVPGVAVTITGVGLRRTTVTRADGRFLVEELPPGVYRIRGDLVGFRTSVVEAVKVAADRTAEADLVMRLGILGHVDYVLPAGGIRGALRAANIVAHVRVVASLGAALLGSDETLLATQHAATVLAVVKSTVPGLSSSDPIRFWQHSAGEWREDGRLIVGPEPPYATGQEFVAFLKEDPQWGRGEFAGPHLMFPVTDGAVSWHGQPTDGLRQGMNVAEFLVTLRRLL